MERLLRQAGPHGPRSARRPVPEEPRREGSQLGLLRGSRWSAQAQPPPTDQGCPLVQDDAGSGPPREARALGGEGRCRLNKRLKRLNKRLNKHVQHGTDDTISRTKRRSSASARSARGLPPSTRSWVSPW